MVHSTPLGRENVGLIPSRCVWFEISGNYSKEWGSRNPVPEYSLSSRGAVKTPCHKSDPLCCVEVVATYLYTIVRGFTVV